MWTRGHVRHTHSVNRKTNPVTHLVMRHHADGSATPLAAGYQAGGVPYPTHIMTMSDRPIAATASALSLASGGQRPRGPVVDARGNRYPGGVGTDLTDPATWQRPYAFPGGQYPAVPKLHFT